MEDCPTKAHKDYERFNDELENQTHHTIPSEWFADYCVKIQKLNVPDNDIGYIEYDDGSYITADHFHNRDNVSCYHIQAFNSDDELTHEERELNPYTIIIEPHGDDCDAFLT